MNKFLTFALSRDGAVTFGTLLLLAAVSHFNTERPVINFIARLGNLAVFLYILWRAAGQQIVAFFKNRRETIQHDLDSLSARRDEAEKSLADLEKRLSNLEAEREAILAESRTQAEAIKAAIIAKAEKDAASIVEAAQRSAASQSGADLAALRAELATEIGKNVEEALRKNLSQKQHLSLIHNSLEKVALQ